WYLEDLKFNPDPEKRISLDAALLLPFTDSFGDSPYEAISPYAIHPRHIDWDLVRYPGMPEGLDPRGRYHWFKETLAATDPEFQAFLSSPVIDKLREYADVKAIFALRGPQDGPAQDSALRARPEYADLVGTPGEARDFGYYLYEQFIAHRQLREAVSYVYEKLGIRMGFDIPFFPSDRGALAFHHPEDFFWEEVTEPNRAKFRRIKAPRYDKGHPAHAQTWWGQGLWNYPELQKVDYEPILAPFRFWRDMGFRIARWDAAHMGPHDLHKAMNDQDLKGQDFLLIPEQLGGTVEGKDNDRESLLRNGGLLYHNPEYFAEGGYEGLVGTTVWHRGDYYFRVSSTHDSPRMTWIYRNLVGPSDNPEIEKLKMTSVHRELALTMEGYTFVQGDERGHGGQGKDDMRLNIPLTADELAKGRKEWHWDMFSPMDESAARYDLRPEIARLVRLRKEHPVLRRAGTLDYIWNTQWNKGVSSFVRRSSDETILVINNLSGVTQKGELVFSDHPEDALSMAGLGIPADRAFRVLDLQTGRDIEITPKDRQFYFELKPGEAHILDLKSVRPVSQSLGEEFLYRTLAANIPDFISFDPQGKPALYAGGRNTHFGDQEWGRDFAISMIGLNEMARAGEFIEFPEGRRSAKEVAADLIRRWAGMDPEGRQGMDPHDRRRINPWHSSGDVMYNVINWYGDYNRNTVDAPLWFVEAVFKYVDATGDAAILREKTRDDRSLIDILGDIIDRLAMTDDAEFTRRGIQPASIRRDAKTGFLLVPRKKYTWMDTDFTERQGYPVEIQALWFNALNRYAEMTEMAGRAGSENAAKARRLAGQVRENFLKYFWRADKNHLYDVLGTDGVMTAEESVSRGWRDGDNQPNQLFAVYFGLVSGREAAGVLEAVERELLIPGALRSLSPKSSRYRHDFEVAERDGLHKNAAYHSGLGWVWLYPFYFLSAVKAGVLTRESAQRRMKADLEPIVRYNPRKSLPELLSGDAYGGSHARRGPDVQSWSVLATIGALHQLSAAPQASSVGAEYRGNPQTIESSLREGLPDRFLQRVRDVKNMSEILHRALLGLDAKALNSPARVKKAIWEKLTDEFNLVFQGGLFTPREEVELQRELYHALTAQKIILRPSKRRPRGLPSLPSLPVDNERRVFLVDSLLKQLANPDEEGRTVQARTLAEAGFAEADLADLRQVFGPGGQRMGWIFAHAWEAQTVYAYFRDLTSPRVDLLAYRRPTWIPESVYPGLRLSREGDEIVLNPEPAREEWLAFDYTGHARFIAAPPAQSLGQERLIERKLFSTAAWSKILEETGGRMARDLAALIGPDRKIVIHPVGSSFYLMDPGGRVPFDRVGDLDVFISVDDTPGQAPARLPGDWERAVKQAFYRHLTETLAPLKFRLEEGAAPPHTLEPQRWIKRGRSEKPLQLFVHHNVDFVKDQAYHIYLMAESLREFDGDFERDRDWDLLLKRYLRLESFLGSEVPASSASGTPEPRIRKRYLAKGAPEAKALLALAVESGRLEDFSRYFTGKYRALFDPKRKTFPEAEYAVWEKDLLPAIEVHMARMDRGTASSLGLAGLANDIFEKKFQNQGRRKSKVTPAEILAFLQALVRVYRSGDDVRDREFHRRMIAELRQSPETRYITFETQVDLHLMAIESVISVTEIIEKYSAKPAKTKTAPVPLPTKLMEVHLTRIEAGQTLPVGREELRRVYRAYYNLGREGQRPTPLRIARQTGLEAQDIEEALEFLSRRLKDLNYEPLPTLIAQSLGQSRLNFTGKFREAMAAALAEINRRHPGGVLYVSVAPLSSYGGGEAMEGSDLDGLTVFYRGLDPAQAREEMEFFQSSLRQAGARVPFADFGGTHYYQDLAWIDVDAVKEIIERAVTLGGGRMDMSRLASNEEFFQVLRTELAGRAENFLTVYGTPLSFETVPRAESGLILNEVARILTARERYQEQHPEKREARRLLFSLERHWTGPEIEQVARLHRAGIQKQEAPVPLEDGLRRELEGHRLLRRIDGDLYALAWSGTNARIQTMSGASLGAQEEDQAVSLNLPKFGEVWVPAEFSKAISKGTQVIVRGSNADVRNIFESIRRGDAVVLTGRFHEVRRAYSILANRKGELARLGPVDGETELDRARSEKAWLRTVLSRLMIVAQGETFRNIAGAPDLGVIHQALDTRGEEWNGRSILIPVRTVLGMIETRRRAREGVEIDVLGSRVLVRPTVLVPFEQEMIRMIYDRLDLREGDTVLDMGTGTGVLALVAAEKARDLGLKKVRIIATDINPEAVANARENVEKFGLGGVVEVRGPGNLFETVKDLRFDWIIFNAPWVRGEARRLLDRAIYDRDLETIRAFLAEAPSYLTQRGRLLLEYSDYSDLGGYAALTQLPEWLRQSGLEIAGRHDKPANGQPAGRRARAKTLAERQQVSLYDIRSASSLGQSEAVDEAWKDMLRLWQPPASEQQGIEDELRLIGDRALIAVICNMDMLRGPTMELVLKQMIREHRLDLTLGVISAGMSPRLELPAGAGIRSPISRSVFGAARAFGIDLSLLKPTAARFFSKPLDRRIAERADLILVAEESMRDQILAQFAGIPKIRDKVVAFAELQGSEGDLPDAVNFALVGKVLGENFGTLMQKAFRNASSLGQIEIEASRSLPPQVGQHLSNLMENIPPHGRGTVLYVLTELIQNILLWGFAGGRERRPIHFAWDFHDGGATFTIRDSANPFDQNAAIQAAAEEAEKLARMDPEESFDYLAAKEEAYQRERGRSGGMGFLTLARMVSLTGHSDRGIELTYAPLEGGNELRMRVNYASLRAFIESDKKEGEQAASLGQEKVSFRVPDIRTKEAVPMEMPAWLAKGLPAVNGGVSVRSEVSTIIGVTKGFVRLYSPALTRVYVDALEPVLEMLASRRSGRTNSDPAVESFNRNMDWYLAGAAVSPSAGNIAVLVEGRIFRSASEEELLRLAERFERGDLLMTWWNQPGQPMRRRMKPA
ncbi:MAG: methyltransferase domain-containing protein, partial [Candidatus Omnitrophica bacterium]|nr:methyltransferase domain-containing protein [Candidatus Omnitrophota bacterium]